MEHLPVLLKEMSGLLSPRDGGVYFDGTFGGGGYARAILETADCKVIAFDRDPRVRDIAVGFKARYGERFNFFHAKFGDAKAILKGEKVDGVVLDLGVSNMQLTDPSGGFSFNLPGPIDMRMGLCDRTALEVIRKCPERELADIIYEFGEERFSRRIAANLKANIEKIRDTRDLAEAIRACVRKTGRKDPATKTFQALRIFVNDEIGELKRFLDDIPDLLNPGGKAAAVSFHSLEDRAVKLSFRSFALGEKGLRFKLLTKKPIVPSAEEIRYNPKSRSAKLRGISML
ncbi:MAG: 16S rRNA (cytosine(1402)-N(4))-methyltransferase RsmH [Holosporaceae bacterium]|jgi:16S rRNA (cytosine1402-N4)-methyltransferase|nr:16S rRNA (cytosine(1402)-N(4))-methyltransferase RsmH [Holosporaceae bacterium]